MKCQRLINLQNVRIFEICHYLELRFMCVHVCETDRFVMVIMCYKCHYCAKRYFITLTFSYDIYRPAPTHTGHPYLEFYITGPSATLVKHWFGIQKAAGLHPTLSPIQV